MHSQISSSAFLTGVNAPLKRNIPLSDADLASLEELLFNAEAVESREQFEEVYGKNLSLKLIHNCKSAMMLSTRR